jgi:hypothetical protein
MTKRPHYDLASITSDIAVPMQEAHQRAPQPLPPKPANTALAVPPAAPKPAAEPVEPLNFKVSSSFRKRFRQNALDANLKLNELLLEALDAWEAGRGLPKT